ncbi:unnamed protein product [Owenia fusiformis]|uniref:Uncharacterized protein n=1 Tax=Owenia fusiformis TaxID=6347 RepID=A0A8J1U867_OWEFU|nr:unnamed protein product [Owenia fusiformis]
MHLPNSRKVHEKVRDMALACQKNSYLKELNTVVKSCEPATLKTVLSGKKVKLNGFEVILEDTVLFPEGGGQPDDRGKISGVEVLRVTRKGTDGVHFTPTPFDIGSNVHLEVDWTRRFDNMQQHSGQHLVTAIADSVYGFKTTSWNLGEKTSFIELDTPKVSNDQLENIENIVNEKIRAGIAMYPTLYENAEDPEVEKARARGLPDDHVGPVRIVTIEGIEANLCCGTHVSNLSHLQSIKLLGVEKGKKNHSNLVFVAGNRVLNYLGTAYNNEKALTGLLKTGPDQHAELVEKTQKNLKIAQKSALTLMRDLAILEAKMFKSNGNAGNYFTLHRKEGDSEFMNIIVNEINSGDVLIFLTTGDEKGAGLFLLAGTEDQISHLGPKVAEVLEGKGAGKKGKFQGKANKLNKRTEAEIIIKDYLKNCGINT